MVFESLTAPEAGRRQRGGGAAPSGAFLHVRHPKSVCISNVEAETNGSLLLIHHLLLETERGDGDEFALHHHQHFTSQGQLFLHPRSDPHMCSPPAASTLRTPLLTNTENPDHH